MSEPISLHDLKRICPGASASTIARNSKAGDSRIRAVQPEPVKGSALDGGTPGEATGRNDAGQRFKISFRIYAVRPLDWDNYCLKQIQDRLIEGGILRGDHWLTLRGEVSSAKVHAVEEERTEITIERLT